MPGAALAGINQSNGIFILPLIVLLFGVLLYGWLELIYRNFTYEYGEREFVIRQGVMTRKTTVIPYAAIQDIASERSLLERALGLATLEIETAGSAHLASEITLPGISNKDALISHLMQFVEKAKSARGMEAMQEGADAGQLLAGILKELKFISYQLHAMGKKMEAQPSAKEEKKGEKQGEFESYEKFRKR